MITIFRTFYDKQPYYISIETALNRIRDGKSAELVNWVQQAVSDAPEYAKRKRKLPCIMFAGQFAERAISGLIKHSGYICLDFDHFPDYETLLFWRDSLQDSEYTFALFISPSGSGLKCVVKIPECGYKDHKAYFRGLQAYYGCEYFDQNVFDVSRICFESYDPDIYVNPDSQMWTGQIFDPEPVKFEYAKATLGEQETARRLLVWSGKKFPIVPGSRNQNLYRLCCSLNDFGINKDYALSLVAQYQCDDFKIGEIVTTLNSAYRKVNKHGSLKF